MCERSDTDPVGQIRSLVDSPRGVRDLQRETTIARLVHELHTGADFVDVGRVEVGPPFGGRQKRDEEPITPSQKFMREFGNA